MKTVLKNYSFSVAGKTITLTDVSTVRLDRLALITDVATGKILYNFADSTVSTATVATNVITLSVLQGGEANTDKLRIDYDTLTGDAGFGDTTAAVQVQSSALPTGAATAAKQDTGNTSVASIDTKTPALGQALAAASVPVILPAATVTTLTPPAAITGFATAAKQPALGTAGSASTDVVTVQGIASGTAQPVSLASVPSHAVTNAGTFAVQATEADGANTTLGSKADAKSTATDTTAITAMQVLKQISASVQAPPSQAVTNAGTFAVQAAAAGDVANAATDSGNPQKIGGVGKTANPTAVTDGQRVNATFDKLGKQVVVGSIRDLKGDAALTLTSTTTETSLIAAVASTFIDVYGLIVTNISATATEVIFRDVTAGTPRFSIMVPAGDTRGFMLSESAAYKQATVNTAWTAQCVTSVASVKISALYVKNI